MDDDQGLRERIAKLASVARKHGRNHRLGRTLVEAVGGRVSGPSVASFLHCFSIHPETEDDMPEAWSNKDERKYEHIKEGYEERGKSEDEAEEIAARTVNKGRREEERTPNSRTQGTGNPNAGLESRTKDELENRAKELNVSGYSSMNKDELVRAIRDKE